MPRMNFSERMNTIFSNIESNYEQMNRLMQDRALRREIYDAETGVVIPNQEVEDTILGFSRQVLGVTEDMLKAKDTVAIRRAVRGNRREWYDVIEDTLIATNITGLQQNEWFNEMFETIGIGYGDRQDFISNKETVLYVAKAGESHHDHNLQRLAKGERYTIPTARYVIKVGADINKYILGDISWADYIAAVNTARFKTIQKRMLSTLKAATAQLPSQSEFVGNGTLSASNKKNFWKIANNVSDANDGASVMIIGTKTALDSIADIIDVNWLTDKQRNDMADTGAIGEANGNLIVKLPNRYDDTTYTSKVFDDDVLYMFARGENNKIGRYVIEGQDEINEITDKGEQNGHWLDIMSYEVQWKDGVGVVPGVIFGQWTLKD